MAELGQGEPAAGTRPARCAFRVRLNGASESLTTTPKCPEKYRVTLFKRNSRTKVRDGEPAAPKRGFATQCGQISGPSGRNRLVLSVLLV